MGRMASRASARIRRTIDQNRIAAEAENGSATAAAAPELPASLSAVFITITGVDTVTSIEAMPAGTVRIYRFVSAGVGVNNGASLIIPNGTSFSTVANHVLTFRSLGSGAWILQAANHPI